MWVSILIITKGYLHRLQRQRQQMRVEGGENRVSAVIGCALYLATTQPDIYLARYQTDVGAMVASCPLAPGSGL